MFLLVFGIQEGHQYDWGTITGPITVWRLIIAGLVVLGLFVLWQARNRSEPLVPLGLFGDRNFSLANLAISTMSFTFTAMGFPLMLYASWCAASPRPRPRCCSCRWRWCRSSWRRSSASYRPGAPADPDRLRLRDHGAGRVAGLARIRPDARCGRSCADGAARLRQPASGRRSRPPPPATCRCSSPGAGAGVYNATRQVGAVLGSAAIAVLIDARLAADGLALRRRLARGRGRRGALPPQVHEAVQHRDGAVAAAARPCWCSALACLGFEQMRHMMRPGHSDPGRCRAGARDDDAEPSRDPGDLGSLDAVARGVEQGRLREPVDPGA